MRLGDLLIYRLPFRACPKQLLFYMPTEVAELPLSHKLWAWFETNRKQALWGMVIIVVLGLIIWFVSWQQGQKEMNASEALSKLSSVTAGTESHPDAAAYLKVAASY